MPLSMAFLDIQNTLRSLDYLADVTFVLDMIKHFNTVSPMFVSLLGRLNLISFAGEIGTYKLFSRISISAIFVF